MKSYQEIGNTIKELRTDKRLTQLQLAEALKVSVATIKRWEQGNIKKVKASQIVNVANYFKVSVYYILGI